jgi:hypothetical protein
MTHTGEVTKAMTHTGDVTKPMTHTGPMIPTGEVPFASSVERACRFAYWTLRLGGRTRPDSVPEIIVSRKLGFICAAIPLCGSRTLKNFFLTNPNVDFEAKLSREPVPNALRLKNGADRTLLFSVVRNPWSRAVSCYEKKVRNAFINRRTYRGYKGAALIAGYPGLRPSMPFDEFVEWLCDERGQDDVANRHWMSQHKFLSLPDLGHRYTDIFRLESLELDLNELLLRLGVQHQAVKRTNSSATTASGRLYATDKEYYTPRTINAVGDRYARDIELFGYDFG